MKASIHNFAAALTGSFFVLCIFTGCFESSAFSKESHYLPVGYLSSQGGKVFELDLDHAIVRHYGEGKLTFEKGIIVLPDGDTLIQSHEMTVVKAGNSIVTMNGDCIALITKDADIVKVRNLWESGHNSVKQYIGKRIVAIPAAQETILGSTFDSTVVEDRIMRKSTRIIELSDEQKISQSEVSLVSIIQSSPIFKALRASHDGGDREIIDKILKMAACMKQISPDRGFYSSTDSSH